MIKFLLLFLVSFSIIAKEDCTETTQQEDPIFEQFCKSPESVICENPNNYGAFAELIAKPFKQTVYDNMDKFGRNGVTTLDNYSFFKLKPEQFNRCISMDETSQCTEDTIKRTTKDIADAYLATDKKKKDFIDKVYAEYLQAQQQHLNDLVEPKEDFLVDIFESAMDVFVTEYEKEIRKDNLEKVAAEKIKQLHQLASRIQPLFTLTKNAEKRFGKSFDFARYEYLENCTTLGIGGSAFVPGGKLKDMPPTIPVTFCPSFMDRVYTTNKIETQRDEIYYYMLSTIAHELGHLVKHIEEHVPHGGKASKTIICMSRHYPTIWNAKGFVMEYKEEIMADIHAVKIFSKELHQRKISKMEKLKFVWVSYKHLCGSKDDGTHPSGTFRLNEILLKDPRIFKMFGCKKFYPKQKLYTCSDAKEEALNNIGI